VARVEGIRPPYWTAARLIATAGARWPDFDGWAASRAVDPIALPLDRFCNLVYYWLTRNANEQRRASIDEHLDRLPAGETRQTAAPDAWSSDAELAAFDSAAASMSRT